MEENVEWFNEYKIIVLKHNFLNFLKIFTIFLHDNHIFTFKSVI
jgi:hypothetical protein